MTFGFEAQEEQWYWRYGFECDQYEDGVLSNMGLWELSESILHLSFKIFPTVLYALLLDCCESSI